MDFLGFGVIDLYSITLSGCTCRGSEGLTILVGLW